MASSVQTSSWARSFLARRPTPSARSSARRTQKSKRKEMDSGTGVAVRLASSRRSNVRQQGGSGICRVLPIYQRPALPICPFLPAGQQLQAFARKQSKRRPPRPPPLPSPSPSLSPTLKRWRRPQRCMLSWPLRRHHTQGWLQSEQGRAWCGLALAPPRATSSAPTTWNVSKTRPASWSSCWVDCPQRSASFAISR